MTPEQMRELADRLSDPCSPDDDDLETAADYLRQCAEQQTNSEQWLLDLMGDWDFTLPRRAFEQIVQSITPHPTSGEQPEPSAAQPMSDEHGPISEAELVAARDEGPFDFPVSPLQRRAIEDAAYERAAQWVDKRAEDYDAEHGLTDPETGSREYPGNGDEYVFELHEIADGLRALKEPQ